MATPQKERRSPAKSQQPSSYWDSLHPKEFINTLTGAQMANTTSQATAAKAVKGPEKRQRWNSRVSFVLAGMGAAIGLGNVWRFPYLCFKHGGATFLVPYLLALLIFGIPITLMELAFGQKFQRGDIGVFRAMHPRLAGVGLMSCFSGCVITWYYVPIIAYACYYFVYSFSDPLPWAPDNEERSDCAAKMTPPAGFFYDDVLQYKIKFYTVYD